MTNELTEPSIEPLDELLREVAAAPSRSIGIGPFRGLEPGDRIGESLEIEAQLGVGGMGVVYKARDLDLDRPVAIKLRRGPATTDDVARLLREAKVMARLSHPNVVTVYEVGTHDGHLFISMEYVDAGSVRDWLDATDRSWREIVDVFVQAGRGLAAAHAVGLIHRDFKPDNVLVDRNGRARVADFGLARSTAAFVPAASVATLETSSPSDRLTRTGAAMGTPAYMAPEQFLGAEIDAAADQFAFCVSLWEALYGRRPFAGDTIDALIASVALERIVPVTSNTRDVPGWLRRVLLRGIRASSRDRYPDMNALLGALGRDPGAWRRRALGLGAVLLAAGASAWWAAPYDRVEPCSGGDDRMASVWSDSRRTALREAFAATGAAHAEAAREHVEGSLDDYAAAWTAMHREACEATRVHGEQSEQLMDHRMACLGQRLSAMEGVTRVLVAVDHTTIEHAPALADGLAPLSRCADAERLLDDVAPPEDPATAERVAELRAQLAEYEARIHARSPGDALERIPALVEAAHATEYAPLMAEVLHVQAQLEDERGDTRAAEAAYDTALWSAVSVRHGELVPRIAIKLAFVVGYNHDDGERAERLLRLAEATLETDATPRLRANIETVRGAIAQRAGDYPVAEAAFRRRLAFEEQAAEEADDPRVAEALVTLAAILDDLERFDEAEQGYERALGMLERSAGEQNPAFGKMLGSYAIHHTRRGEYEAAVPLFERSISIQEVAFGEDAPTLLHGLRMLAQVQSATDDDEGARKTLARAFEVHAKAGGGRDPTYADLLEVQCHLSLRASRWDACIEECQTAHAINMQTLGADHPDVVPPLANSAICLSSRARHDDARKAAERALEVRERTRGTDSVAVVEILQLLASVHLEAHDFEAVLPLTERALKILEARGEADGRIHEAVVLRRTRALEALGRDEDDAASPR